MKTYPYIPIMTRFQVDKGIHLSFNFEQLETPTRGPLGQPCVEEPISDKPQEFNTWHNPLYNFENPFNTPFDTPRVEDRVSLTMKRGNTA